MKTTVRSLLIVIPILLIALISATYAMWVREERLLQERREAILAIIKSKFSAENNQQFCELIRLEPRLVSENGVVSWAARHGDLQTNELVIQNGGDVMKSADMDFYCPVIYALWRGDPAIIERYLVAGVDPNGWNFSVPIRVRKLWRNPPLERPIEDHGEPLLHAACREGNLEVVELLLRHGANIQAKNASGDTCLFTATEEKNRPLVRLLLSRGIDADLTSNDGETVESWLRANKVDGENGERWPELAEILEILTHWREHGELPEEEPASESL